MKKPLVLVSNPVKISSQTEWEQAHDLAPRRDYIEIGRKLGATLVGYDLSDTLWYRWSRRIEKRVRLDLVESVFAAYELSKHNVALSTSEKVAIPLAALLAATNRKIPHVVIAHRLSAGSKTRLFRMWPLHNSFDHLICVCRSHMNYAINQLGMPEAKVTFIHHHVDSCFYRPLNVDTDPYILSVGQEQRDYRTLLRAIAGTGIKLMVVASSPWSSSQIQLDEIGDTIVLSRIPYQELRTLYAKARLVVVPSWMLIRLTVRLP